MSTINSIKNYSVKEALDIIQKQLNGHFNITDIKVPNVFTIKDPNLFFSIYRGLKIRKDFTPNEMTKLDSDVAFYYEPEYKGGSVLFKGFRRSGLHNFKKLNHVTHKISDLLHECIHHFQFNTNGYGGDNAELFDEGCCEFVNYVISADIDQYSEYIDHIVVLWNMMELYISNPIKKYELIKQYNISKNKSELVNTYIEEFLKRYPSIAKNKKHFIEQTTDVKNKTKGFLKYCYKLDKEKTIKDMYKLHDYYIAQEEIVKSFQ